MKKLAIMFLACAASLAAADYSGIWNGKGGMASAKYGSVPYTAQLTLLQDGTALKGTFKAGNGAPVPLTSGSVSGTQVTFAIAGGAVTAVLSQSGTQLVGKMTSSGGGVVSFVFTKRQ